MASIFIFLKMLIANMKYSTFQNFKILRNKMNEKARFEIIFKRCEHVTYTIVRTTSMTIISMMTKKCKSVHLGYSF